MQRAHDPFTAMLLRQANRRRRGIRQREARPKDSFRKWCGLRRARLNTVVGETHAARERRKGRESAAELKRMIASGGISEAELEHRLRDTYNLPQQGPTLPSIWRRRIPSDDPRLEQASRGRA